MDEKPRKSWVAPAVAVALLPVVLTLYVLSYGPAFVAVANGKLSADLFNVVYAPILWHARQSDFVNGVLYSYILMCGFSP
jgi:hypothetical protein